MPAQAPSPLEKHSLMSKLANHFNNRNRNITDFYIEPDDPWRTYYAGDIVKGTVVLAVIKPMRITHLTVCLHGFAKVYKNAVIAGEPMLGEDHTIIPGTVLSRKGNEFIGNGFAPLFEDEISLCGEGRLKEGLYKFKFELEFPPSRLPSSISFERGTISYMITATLTRPTTIAPTISCDKRLIYAETIDIGPLPAPKPRIISLEPISRRQKAKPIPVDSPSKTSSPSTAQNPSEIQVQQVQPSPHSPAVSDLSSSSTVSSSAKSFLNIPDPNRAGASPGREQRTTLSSSPSSLSSKRHVITATTELLKAGALPGDSLPLKILIKHTKPVRSSNGIIITFCRQGRLDWKNPNSRSSKSKGKQPANDDASPKSRTGLGVLSFGNARTNSLFRKDLSQTFAPLYVDPNTMKAAVNTSIRIPEDIFPTIKYVPGGMISFRYYVEVVMDLRGRLDKYLPMPETSKAGPASYSYSPAAQSFQLADAGRNFTSTFGGNILDTEQIRREKSVVSCSFEVIIGTKDSARQYQKPKRHQQIVEDSDDFQPETSGFLRVQSHVSHPDAEAQGTSTLGPLREQNDAGAANDGSVDRDQREAPYAATSHDSPFPPHAYPPPLPMPLSSAPPPHFMPPPEEPEEEIDEKTRVRLAEEALLPSRPPAEEPDEGTSGLHDPSVPSVPVLSHEDEERGFLPGHSSDVPLTTYGSGYPNWPINLGSSAGVGPSSIAPPPFSPSQSFQPFHNTSFPSLRSHAASFSDSASTPRPSHIAPEYTAGPSAMDSTSFQHDTGTPQPTPGPANQSTGEDKQELERQRLLAAASAPDPDADDDDEGIPNAAHMPEEGSLEATEIPPVTGLTEDDILQHTPAIESLPRYQR